MPKQPLRTNQIVSELKAASTPVVYGTSSNAIDALQLALDSPNPISAWVCQTNEGEKSLSVIDLGSNRYLGLDIDPKLGYINCYLASGAIIGKGDKGNQIKGPLFHFLSREDVNDTATQLTTAEGGNDPVIANPSGAATSTLSKLQIGETVFGIEGGSDVYEYTLTAAETAALLAGLTGEIAFEVALGIDYTEALKHPAIRLVAEADVDLDHIKLEALLVEIAQAYANDALADVSYQSSREMGLAGRTAFDLNLVVVNGNPILDGTPHQSSGSASEPNVIVNLNCALSAFATENGAWRSEFEIAQIGDLAPEWVNKLIAAEGIIDSSGGPSMYLSVFGKTTDGVLVPMYVEDNGSSVLVYMGLMISGHIYLIHVQYETDAETGDLVSTIYWASDNSGN